MIRYNYLGGINMLKEKLLPADTFVVLNKTVLNDQDRKILTML